MAPGYNRILDFPKHLCDFNVTATKGKRLSEGKRSLDNLMRLLYNRYHKQQNRGFTEEEFWNAVDEVSGASMAHVRYFIDNPTDIDYERYFAPAGLKLDRSTWTISRAE